MNDGFRVGDTFNYLVSPFNFYGNLNSTSITHAIGNFFGHLGYELGNAAYFLTHWLIIFILLFKYFSLKERVAFYLISFLPSIGLFSSLFSKEMILILAAVILFSGFRASSRFLIFIGIAILVFFKPTFSVALVSIIFLHHFGKRRQFSNLFVANYFTILIFIVFVGFFIYFYWDRLNFFALNFHLYFENGRTNYGTQLTKIYDIFVYFSEMILNWFVPQFGGYFSFKFLLFDIEGILILWIIFKSAPLMTSVKSISKIGIFHMSVILTILLSLGPYAIFNLGSTLRYRTFLLTFLILYSMEIKRLIKLQKTR